MRTLSGFLEAYGESHRNPVNQMVHFICVPLIFFASLGLLWLVPVGAWLGLETDVARWVNGGTLLGVLAGLFYLRLGPGVFVLMAAWFFLSVAGILAIRGAGLPLGWVSLAIWVGGWIAQVWGHKVEGRKPSFVDDLVFLLIGPIFVSAEIAARLGIRTSRVRRD